jgi:hypothetical protein
MLRSPIHALVVAAAALCAASCTDFEGAEPPTDALHFPIGVEAHPGGRYGYVVNSNFDGKYRFEQGGAVTVLDLSGDSPTPVAGAGVRVASYGSRIRFIEPFAGANGRLLVTTRGDNALNVLEVSPDGSRIWCDGDSSFAVAADGTLSERPEGAHLDTAEACRVGGLPEDPFAILPLGGSPLAGSPPRIADHFAITGLGGSVSIVTLRDLDPTRVDIATLRVESDTTAIAAVGSSLVTASRRAGSLAVTDWFESTDGGAGIVTRQSSLATPVATTLDARSFGFSSATQRLYLTLGAGDSVLVLDLSVNNLGRPALDIIDQFRIEGRPTELVVRDSEEGPVLYVLLSERDQLVAVDGITGAVRVRIEVGSGPADIVEAPGNRLLVSLFDGDAVRLVGIGDASPYDLTLRGTGVP